MGYNAMYLLPVCFVMCVPYFFGSTTQPFLELPIKHHCVTLCSAYPMSVLFLRSTNPTSLGRCLSTRHIPISRNSADSNLCAFLQQPNPLLLVHVSLCVPFLGQQRNQFLVLPSATQVGLQPQG